MTPEVSNFTQIMAFLVGGSIAIWALIHAFARFIEARATQIEAKAKTTLLLAQASAAATAMKTQADELALTERRTILDLLASANSRLDANTVMTATANAQIKLANQQLTELRNDNAIYRQGGQRTVESDETHMAHQEADARAAAGHPVDGPVSILASSPEIVVLTTEAKT